MSKENDKVLEIYDKHANEYLEKNYANISKDTEKTKQEMLKKCLANTLKNGKIFEVGSASGKDAKFFRSLGYENITVSDVSDVFLKTLAKNGFSPVKFNLIKDVFPDKYDFIYAWAVLQHLTKSEAKTAITKIYNALNNGGKMLICVKTDERYDENYVSFLDNDNIKIYCSYWSKDELQNFLEETGFINIDIWGYGKWFNCLAER